jgi:hypothetical protein
MKILPAELSFQVFLIYKLPDSRYPYAEPYTWDELGMSKNFLRMYYTFAMNVTPFFGRTELGPILDNGDLRANEIMSSEFVNFSIVQTTYGNSMFWNLLE